MSALEGNDIVKEVNKRVLSAQEEKSKADRLKETIHLLKQLGNMGYTDLTPGFPEIKAALKQWVQDGEKCEKDIDMFKHNRIAELRLPKFANKAATLKLRVIREGDTV
jgi:hypothetical protein